tara:strand:+ start:5102 stop:5839 length:738 start_codon:yes stop_codon:yes gene_type:complete
MKLFVLSLFPEESRQFFLKGIFKRGYDAGIFDITFLNLRDFSDDKHRKVDDYPYGDKHGMLLKADIIYKAVTSIPDYQNMRVIFPCPKGPVLDQSYSTDCLSAEGIIIIAGYYEGVDDRLFQLLSIETVSVGNVVLSSGESPSLMLAESIIRLIPGVVGKQSSVEDDSILSGLLKYPQYTEPRAINGLEVPEVVTSGHHMKKARWQRYESLKKTLFNKPDMVMKYELTSDDQNMIADILKENRND